MFLEIEGFRFNPRENCVVKEAMFSFLKTLPAGFLFWVVCGSMYWYRKVGGWVSKKILN